jgi:type IV secretion system protein VirB10
MTEEQKGINVGEELTKRDQQRLEGERNTSALKSSQSRLMPGSRTLVALLLGVSSLVGGIMAYKAYQAKNAPQADAPPPTTVRNTLPPLTPNKDATPIDSEASPPPTAPPDSDVALSEMMDNPNSKEPTPEELLRQRRLTSNLIDTEGGQSQPAQASASSSSSQGGGELQQKMQPLRLEAAMAGQLGDRHYLLTQGSMIDCVLETRMITTQPGMTACYVTRDIYSANGRVVLLDRGSKVIGHYQGGITQGQARIFVLWSRIETPRGIIINLDSPGTGTLGEGGVGGYVDTHFWERFGGAILLSLIDDFSNVAAQRMADSNSKNNNQFNFSSTTNNAQTMAAEALKNSINIPPTLYKNQGERVSIFVARDLDFRSVYELKRR